MLAGGECVKLLEGGARRHTQRHKTLKYSTRRGWVGEAMRLRHQRPSRRL